MPFPFYWLGALIAAAFLMIVMTIFGLLLKVMDRAATEVHESIVPGLIAGIRKWADDQGMPTPAVSAPRAGDEGSSIEEASAAEGLRMERVRRGR